MDYIRSQSRTSLYDRHDNLTHVLDVGVPHLPIVSSHALSSSESGSIERCEGMVEVPLDALMSVGSPFESWKASPLSNSELWRQQCDRLTSHLQPSRNIQNALCSIQFRDLFVCKVAPRLRHLFEWIADLPRLLTLPPLFSCGKYSSQNKGTKTTKLVI
jgi:hypothetical protein